MAATHIQLIVYFYLISVLSQSGSVDYIDNNLDYVYSNLFTAPNPDAYLTTPKIIQRHGYQAETHIIQTEDGYLLEYHRIPYGKGQKEATQAYPIILFHPLLTSSAIWVTADPEKALAFKLADEGYDVWLANVRGNTYSKSHITLNPNTDPSFWNFSFHEAGMYDLPAAVDYILEETSAEKVIYVGYSLGTTTFFAFMATRPEYADKVLVSINMAPVGALSHTSSPFNLFVPLTKAIQSIPGSYNLGPLAQHSEITETLLRIVCGPVILDYNVCKQSVLFFLLGQDEQQFNNTLIPVILNILPAGTSVKNILHFIQLIGSGGRFEYYDYGPENLKRYGSRKPPTYDVEAISVPMKFYSSKNDILADLTDAELLYEKVSQPVGITIIDFDLWNHIDYILAIDVNKYFNNPVLEFLANVTSESDFITKTVEKELAKRRKGSHSQDCPFVEPTQEVSAGNLIPQVD